MTIHALVLHPDPRLKKPCDPVDGVDAEVQTLIDDMLETMYDAAGIGLAACQIGVLKRVLVMDCNDREEGAEPAPIAMVNPQITWQSEDLNTYEEGCLSIPDALDSVTRPREVRVSYLDREGQPQEQAFDGLWATCVQHEIDHLDGKLFIDYLSPLKRNMVTRKMLKYKKLRE